MPRHFFTSIVWVRKRKLREQMEESDAVFENL